jgi:hypothetical protein
MEIFRLRDVIEMLRERLLLKDELIENMEWEKKLLNIGNE